MSHSPATPTSTSLDANAQLLALLDATVDAIIIINKTGIIEGFNQAANTMFGYQSSEVIGENVSMLMPEPFKAHHDGYIQHYLQSNDAQIIGIGREVQGVKKNGHIFPIELSVGEVKQASHKQFVGIIRDISERIKVQADLAQSRERLAQFTRLSTMGEMAAGIAHEINQPLTAIASYAQACRNFIAQSETKQNDKAISKVKSALDKISTQTYRASEVIKRLRRFVQKGHVTRESVELNSLIKQTINLAQADTRLSELGVQLHLIEGQQPQVDIDDIQIQQVLINLINNAIDASQGTNQKPIQIVCRWNNNQQIEISVADSGAGVSPGQEDALFDPFFTTKTTGMGIGLCISQTIVEAHNGKLTYSAGVPNGSVFTFTLPAKKSKESKP